MKHICNMRKYSEQVEFPCFLIIIVIELKQKEASDLTRFHRNNNFSRFLSSQHWRKRGLMDQQLVLITYWYNRTSYKVFINY